MLRILGFSSFLSAWDGLEGPRDKERDGLEGPKGRGWPGGAKGVKEKGWGWPGGAKGKGMAWRGQRDKEKDVLTAS